MDDDIIVLPAGDPTISLRISTLNNNILNKFRSHFASADNQRGKRTDVARAILSAILDESIMDRIIALSRDRREYVSATLRQLVLYGIERAEAESTDRTTK